MNVPADPPGPPDPLDYWPAEEPPEGFAGHTLAALNTADRPRRTRVWALAGAAAAAACLVVWGASLRPRHGHLAAEAREQVSIGSRAVAVAEGGAVLDWSVDWSRGGRSGRVVQTAGEVFYRVDAGGPFTVETPYAAVTVSGTCFTVEVAPMASNRGLVAAAAAGALAGGIAVAVYEGHVRVQNAHGAIDAAPGDRVHAGAANAPSLALEPTPPALMVARDPGQSEAQPRETLVDRERAAQAQVAALQARVRTLEQERAALAARVPGPGALYGGENLPYTDKPSGPLPDGRPPWDKFHGYSASELKALASQCELRNDTPPLQVGPWTMSPEQGAELHLSDAEQQTAAAVVDRLGAETIPKLRALYVEATGDVAGSETLELSTLGQEILHKGGKDLEVQARTRLSQELAGLSPPPADLSKTSPQERYLRLMNGLGGALQRDLEKSFGAQQASQLRDKIANWRMTMNGCAN
jgi:hypothetical protein